MADRVAAPGPRLGRRVLFLGILFLAIYIKPIWLAALVLLGGFAVSSVAWIAILNRWARHAGIARKVPKT